MKHILQAQNLSLGLKLSLANSFLPCLGLSDEGKYASYSVSWLGKAVVCEAFLSRTIKFIGSVSNLEFCRVLIFAVLHLEPPA